MRCWQTVSACFLQHPSSLWKTRWYTVISTYSPFRCLLSPTFKRPISLVVVHSSFCDGIIPQVTIHTQPAGNYACIVRITFLWSLTIWKLYLLTVVSPHTSQGLGREGLCGYKMCRICVAHVLGLYFCPADIKERFTNYVLLLIVCLRNMEQFSWNSGLD